MTSAPTFRLMRPDRVRQQPSSPSSEIRGDSKSVDQDGVSSHNAWFLPCYLTRKRPAVSVKHERRPNIERRTLSTGPRAGTLAGWGLSPWREGRNVRMASVAIATALPAGAVFRGLRRSYELRGDAPSGDCRPPVTIVAITTDPSPRTVKKTAAVLLFPSVFLQSVRETAARAPKSVPEPCAQRAVLTTTRSPLLACS
jgi:hypothetical protein